MSTFEDSRYRWRETYFVLFDAKNRPALKTVVKTLSALNKRFELTNRTADSHGHIESLTLISPDDFAALDICYTERGGSAGADGFAGRRPEEGRRRGAPAGALGSRSSGTTADSTCYTLSRSPSRSTTSRTRRCSTRVRCWSCWPRWAG